MSARDQADHPAQSLPDELLRRARGGDRDAFEALALIHRDRLLKLIGSRLGAGLKASIEVEDVMQETLLRSLRSLPVYQGGGGEPFLRWLGGVAQHVMQEAARQQKRGILLPLNVEPPSGDTSVEKRGERRERFERLERSLASLSEEHRRVIVLARIRRLPMKTVASEMGRTVEAATQLLWRALRKLKLAFGTTDSLGLPEASLDSASGGDVPPGNADRKRTENSDGAE